MIKRTSNRATESLVNTASEEHFNVTKAIRDDAPVTDSVTVVKSLNFESTGDGAYQLRKPLIKKGNFNSSSNILLSNNEDILTVTGTDSKQLDIPGYDYVYIKFYDKMLQLRNFKYSLPLTNIQDWLEIKDAYNTPDHTILNTLIKRPNFQLMFDLPGTARNAGFGKNSNFVYFTVYYDFDDYIFDEAEFTSAGGFKQFFKLKSLSYTVTGDDDIPRTFEFSGDDIYQSVPSEDTYGAYIDMAVRVRKADGNLGYRVIVKTQVPLDEFGTWATPFTSSNITVSVSCMYWYDLIEDDWNGWQSGTSYNTQLTIGPNLNRYIKVYPHETESDAYVIEIVHPEFNSITSGTDANNSETLDINLLLDNPYAIRDLYGYGYMSTTKILAYVPNSNMTKNNILKSPIWRLTEKGGFKCSGVAFPNQSYDLLVSSSQAAYDSQFLVLKAFITTVDTEAKYYACWEYSSDDGITWKTCPEFLSNYTDKLVSKYVSDLTSAEFDKVMADESLEKAASYLVEKQLVPFVPRSTVGTFYQEDAIKWRPDVLVLEKPNFKYKYRFLLYLDTEKSTPTPIAETHTVTKTVFSAGDESQGYIDANNKIKYTTATNKADVAPSVQDGYLLLPREDYGYEGGATENDPYIRPLGASIQILSTDTDYKITKVSVTLGPKELVTGTTNYQNLGSCVGIVSGNTPSATWTSTNENPYGMDSVTIEDSTVITHCKNLWKSEGSSFYVEPDSYGDGPINLVNLTSCLHQFGGADSDLPALIGVDNFDLVYNLKIKSISVTYTVQQSVTSTSIYLVSSTGAYQVPYSSETVLAENLSADRNRLFSGKMYYNANQAQLLIYSGNYIYSSGTDSAIIKLLNAVYVPEEISKLVPWRGYFLVFTPRNIYLSEYNSSFDGYNLRVLSNTVGVAKIDADTIAPILNSVYFKSGAKIYRLTPNKYASIDNILNIYQVSMGVNNILEDLLNGIEELGNFAYANADTYMLFIPTTSLTYCITYDFTKQIWNMHTYPGSFTGIESLSATENYLKDATAWYYFTESLKKLLYGGLKEYATNNHVLMSDYNLDSLMNAMYYADYKSLTPLEIITKLINNQDVDSYKTDIPFLIDFGQKSSNYTIDKQFLETKIILATLSPKDMFPISVDIRTDGVSRDIHWDANTDGAIWRQVNEDKGILNTGFYPVGTDFNGIMRQCIIKYSGQGKTIRHVISGKSKSLFKFYSMDVRARILPKKH